MFVLAIVGVVRSRDLILQHNVKVGNKQQISM